MEHLWLILVSIIIVFQGIEASTVRLVDGDSAENGRVEILRAGRWYTVCSYRFDYLAGMVICRMLGYGDSNVTRVFDDGHYGQGFGGQWPNYFDCDGSETDIDKCSSPRLLSFYGCDHRSDVGVTCGKTQIRLVNGPTKNSGRVEVLHAGKWGSICSSSGTFSKNDVQVICRNLGINNPDAFGFSRSVYGEGTGHVALWKLNCDGSEADIALCGGVWMGPHVSSPHLSLCSHQLDVGVNCDGKTPIRLVNGDSEQSGRVEIQTVNGHWGTVWDSHFDRHDLQVVCRMLGYTFSESSFYMPRAFYGQGAGQVLVWNLDCDGDESDIGLCGGSWSTTTTDDDHSQDVGVSCDGKMSIRVVGGLSNSSGRVEFLMGGYYRTICSHGFDHSDLMVVCRMLGYESLPAVADWRRTASHNIGLGGIGASNLGCDGTESSIGRCIGNFPAERTCTHANDVFVNCNGEQEPMRLVAGPTNYSGTVEIQVSGVWGTICGSSGFSRENAVVVCRIMKFANPEQAVAYPNAHFGQGTGPVMMSVDCNGHENNLDQCKVNMDPQCSHRYDVGVDCCPRGGDCGGANQGVIVG